MTTPTEKDPYSILGVSRDATTQEVRDAYRARARIAHPDRFDRLAQAEDWKNANEMLRELNLAYAILGDVTKRREYDQHKSASTTSPRAQQTPPPPRPPPQSSTRPPVENGELTPGHARLADLPRHARDRLIGRQEGREQDQFRIRIAGAGAHYFWLVVLGIWFVVLYTASNGPQWESETLSWFWGITAVVGLLAGTNILALVRSGQSTLKPYLYLTPLYFIKTADDIVSFYPLWALKDIAITHNYRNGSYQDTTVELKFTDHTESLSLSPKHRVDSMLEAMRRWDAAARGAFQSGNRAYFEAHDDFGGVARGGPYKRRVMPARTQAGVYAASVAVSSLGLLAGIRINSLSAETRWVYHPPPAATLVPSVPAGRPAPTPVHVKRPEFPEQPLPGNGRVQVFTTAERIAPFEIKSAVGSHYLLKLVNTYTHKPALTVFVRGGDTVNIDVPVGRYEVRYACGNTWYGDEYLFGPDTAYSKADEPFLFSLEEKQVSGYTITLYTVPNGNLRTSAIDPTEF